MILYNKGEEKADTIVGKAPSTGLTTHRLVSPPLKGEALRRPQVTSPRVDRGILWSVCGRFYLAGEDAGGLAGDGTSLTVLKPGQNQNATATTRTQNQNYGLRICPCSTEPKLYRARDVNRRNIPITVKIPRSKKPAQRRSHGSAVGRRSVDGGYGPAHWSQVR